jgi:hypothetical protein
MSANEKLYSSIEKEVKSLLETINIPNAELKYLTTVEVRKAACTTLINSMLTPR